MLIKLNSKCAALYICDVLVKREYGPQDATIPAFRLSDKMRLKPVCSAKKTS